MRPILQRLVQRARGTPHQLAHASLPAPTPRVWTDSQEPFQESPPEPPESPTSKDSRPNASPITPSTHSLNLDANAIVPPADATSTSLPSQIESAPAESLSLTRRTDDAKSDTPTDAPRTHDEIRTTIAPPSVSPTFQPETTDGIPRAEREETRKLPVVEPTPVAVPQVLTDPALPVPAPPAIEPVATNQTEPRPREKNVVVSPLAREPDQSLQPPAPAPPAQDTSPPRLAPRENHPPPPAVRQTPRVVIGSLRIEVMPTPAERPQKTKVVKIREAAAPPQVTPSTPFGIGQM